MKLIFFITMFSFILFNCSDKKQKVRKQIIVSKAISSVINEPLPELRIKPTIFTLNAERNETVELESGSSIEIKKNSLINEQGEVVKGQFQIEWTEYHTLSDILLSGIPMEYDSLGKQYNLVSGGMFKINALQDGKKLDVKEGKEIKVNIASINDTPCLNFYKLDTVSGKWDYKTSKRGKIIQSNNESSTTFLEIKIKTDSFPELKGKNILLWKTDDKLSDEELILLKSNRAIAKIIKKISEKDYEVQIRTKNYDKLFKLSPVTVDDLSQISEKQHSKIKTIYKKLLAIQDKAEKRHVDRTISINGFGIFNWDVVLKQKDPIASAKFDFPSTISKKRINIFQIIPESNAIIKISPDNSQVTLSKQKTFIVAVMPNDYIYVCNALKFNELKCNYNEENPLNIKMDKTNILPDSNLDLTTALRSFL
jgi:hypothetical protein